LLGCFILQSPLDPLPLPPFFIKTQVQLCLSLLPQPPPAYLSHSLGHRLALHLRIGEGLAGLVLLYLPGWGGAGTLPHSSPHPAFQLLHPNPEWVGSPPCFFADGCYLGFAVSLSNLLLFSLTSCFSPGPWVMVTPAQLSILSPYIFCYRFLYVQTRNFCNLIPSLK